MKPSVFAEKWINDWNSKDLEKILLHYAADVEITTPMIKMALGIDEGTLRGKSAVEKYWRDALKKFPALHFELLEVTESINSMAIYYKSVMNKRAIEVIFFNDQGEISKTIAFYTS